MNEFESLEKSWTMAEDTLLFTPLARVHVAAIDPEEEPEPGYQWYVDEDAEIAFKEIF